MIHSERCKSHVGGQGLWHVNVMFADADGRRMCARLDERCHIEEQRQQRSAGKYECAIVYCIFELCEKGE